MPNLKGRLSRWVLVAIAVFAVGCSGDKSNAPAGGSGGGGGGGQANLLDQFALRKDAKFDEVQKGMAESDVVALLGGPPWLQTAGASGVWTYPRYSIEQFQAAPDRVRQDIQEVLFVYFRDGKVDNIYRITGQEFAQQRNR